jgi:hypothetical protein
MQHLFDPPRSDPMNEIDPSADPAEPQHRPSLFSQVTDVITSPAELFTELRPLPSSAGTGFAVVCLTVILAILTNCTLFVAKGAMDDVIRRQQKVMEQAVEKGKMTAADASRGMEQMRSVGPVVFVAFGSVAASIFILLASLGWALVVFLAGKFLGGAPVTFGKAYEITGLAFIIGCLSTLASAVLILLRDSLASPSAAIFIEDFDPGSKLHNLLQALNPFSIWFLAVLAIGLACSSGIPIRKALIAFLGFWVVKALIFILIGYGELA